MEQKNGHVVRRFLGYTRFDCPEIIPAINELYDKLEVYLNHFVPSRKCLEKVRIGSRYRRKYDKAKTSYQRVLDHPEVVLRIKEKLKREHEKLNPLLLKNEVDKLIAEIYKKQIHIEPSTELILNRSLDSFYFSRLTGYKVPSWLEMIKELSTE